MDSPSRSLPVFWGSRIAGRRRSKRLRLEREGAALQQEIDRVQEAGRAGDIDRLWQRNQELLRRIAALEITGT